MMIGTMTPATDAAREGQIRRAADHLMATRRIGTASLNSEQRAADDAQMLAAYRDIVGKALAFLDTEAASQPREGEVEDAKRAIENRLTGLWSWLESISGYDWSEIVADGGITAGMVVQQEAVGQRDKVQAIIEQVQRFPAIRPLTQRPPEQAGAVPAGSVPPSPDCTATGYGPEGCGLCQPCLDALPDDDAPSVTPAQALHGITDDYMTSEAHHPGYVLIPAAKFEQLRAASEALPAMPENDWFMRNADRRNPRAFINRDPAYFASECADAIRNGSLSAAPTPPDAGIGSDGAGEVERDKIARMSVMSLGLIAYITGLPEHLRWTPEFTRYVSSRADEIAAIRQSLATQPGDGGR